MLCQLIVHFVRQCEGKHITHRMNLVKQPDEVGLVLTAHHKIDGGGA